MERQLKDYQQYAKNFILTHPCCGLFLDMGCGKTLTTLDALYDENPTWHVLVIAPKSIAMSSWLDEIAKWQYPFRTKSLMINEKGKKLSRKKRLERYAEIPNDPPTIYFISNDLIKDLIDNLPKKNGKPIWYFPTVIIDELQSFKSYGSERFKAMKQIRPQIKQFIGLTGTPAPNGLMDLWAEIYLMDMGARLGPTITWYRETFFNPGLHINGYPVSWTPKTGAEEEIYRRISDLVISEKNPNLQLPDITYNECYVTMTDDEMALYKEFIKTSVLTVAGIEITATNAAVLQGKLSQMASGTLYIDDQHHYEVIHKHKLEYCEYIIDNTTSPVIIAYRFQSDKRELMNYFPNAVAFDGSANMIHAWNDGKIPILLFQPASTCHGLNMQYGGHTLIWYSLPWSLEQYLQTNKRIHRQGQTHPVTIHYILTKNTIDTRVLHVLTQKDAKEQRLLDSVAIDVVKETINDVL